MIDGQDHLAEERTGPLEWNQQLSSLMGTGRFGPFCQHRRQRLPEHVGSHNINLKSWRFFCVYIAFLPKVSAKTGISFFSSVFCPPRNLLDLLKLALYCIFEGQSGREVTSHHRMTFISIFSLQGCPLGVAGFRGIKPQIEHVHTRQMPQYLFKRPNRKSC